MSHDVGASRHDALAEAFSGTLTVRPRADPERKSGLYLGAQAKTIELVGWGLFPVDYSSATHAVKELVKGSLWGSILDLVWVNRWQELPERPASCCVARRRERLTK